MPDRRGVLIGGIHSGSGKTLVTLCLLHGLQERGFSVRPFKCGPDFIDPRFHEWVTGRTSVNLDLFFSGPDEIPKLYDRMTHFSSGGVVEGVMGFFDGLDKGTSTYNVARALDIPVILVVHAKGMAETISSIVQGVQQYRSGWRLDGIIAVQTGSPRHAEILARALERENLPPLLGVLPRHEDFALPERHLGLVDVRELDESGRLARLKTRMTEFTADWDWDRIGSRFIQVQEAPTVLDEEGSIPGATLRNGNAPLRLGVAWDKAFRFYYPENWSILEENGVQLIPVSPLFDRKLPSGLDGLYLGGGYPEHFSEDLSLNRDFLSSVRDFHSQEGLIYAECGGMLYLFHGPEIGPGEQEKEWVGILPFRFRMKGRLKRLGYVRARPIEGGFLGDSMEEVRGHFFHYSELIPLETEGRDVSKTFKPAFDVQGKPEGFQTMNLVASYLHLYFPSSPRVLKDFIEALKTRSETRRPYFSHH
ncbi:MAG: cobyrinate a,c-diamide synthase [Leptospirales bacterium]